VLSCFPLDAFDNRSWALRALLAAADPEAWDASSDPDPVDEDPFKEDIIWFVKKKEPLAVCLVGLSRKLTTMSSGISRKKRFYRLFVDFLSAFRHFERRV